jgi:hypothetical protein
MARADVTQDIDAAAVGHVDVEDHQVPGAIAQLLQRLGPAARLSYGLDRAVLLQPAPQPGADHCMIVGHQHLCH